MENKVIRKHVQDSEEQPRHTRLADIYEKQRGLLFQGWGPKL